MVALLNFSHPPVPSSPRPHGCSSNERTSTHRTAGHTLLVCALLVMSRAAAAAAAARLKIGCIGVGMVGGPLSAQWSAAGHSVFVSSRNPDTLEAPPGGSKGTVLEAVQFADIVLLAIPFSSVPHLPQDVKDALDGKIVLDANNCWPGREGQAAAEALASGKGSGVWTAGQLPGARIVKAFNTWPFFRMRIDRGAANQPAVPLASDDEEAMAVAQQLVVDAGLEAVVVPGGLEAARVFDVETPAGPNSGLAKADLVRVLGLDGGGEM